MHVKLLDPAVQMTAGMLLLRRAEANAPAAKVAHDVLGEQAPEVASNDARAAIQQLLGQLGLERTEQLANVTQADCLRCSKDAIEAMALFALVVVVQAHVADPACGCGPKSCVLPPRHEPLPTLGVDAYAGNYEQPPARSCPLILVLENVAPTTEKSPVKLYLINRSDLDDPKPIELPADLTKAKNGEYSFQAGDTWMNEKGIKPGAVLELYQVKYDEQGQPMRTSEPTVVKVNPRPRNKGVIPSPPLPPGDIVGDVRRLPSFAIDLDLQPGAVNAGAISARLCDGTLTLDRKGDRRAFEPFTKLIAENLSTGKKSELVEVGTDGAFHLDLAASKNDAILLRAIDHSHDLGDPWFERRLVLRAGLDEEPMLARNPSLHFDALPSLAAGRVGLGAGPNCQMFTSDRGLTPGSIVTITRAVEGRSETTTAVAGKDGSLSVRMPFEVHAEDVFDVTVQNPFAQLGKQELQKNAVSKARFEVNGDGSLNLVSSEGAVAAKGTPEGGAAVQALDNADALEKGVHFQVDDFSLGFIPRDGNTGNGGGLKVTVDRRGQPQAFVRLDGNEVVVTMRSQLSEYRQDKPQMGAGVEFASFGGGTRAWDNAAIGPIRDFMLRRQQGEELPVRFETSDGRLMAHAKIRADWGTFQTGGNSIYINEHWGNVRMATETHKNLNFKLVPGSLVQDG